MSQHKFNASVYDLPNTLVTRDKSGSTWLSGILLKGADYFSKNVDPNLTKHGYLYFYSSDLDKYALLKNINDPNKVTDDFHLSLDIAKNSNHNGNFSIRNVDNSDKNNEVLTLFTVKNGQVGINTDSPVDNFHVNSTSTFSNDVKINGDLKINGKIVYSPCLLNLKQTDLVNVEILE